MDITFLLIKMKTPARCHFKALCSQRGLFNDIFNFELLLLAAPKLLAETILACLNNVSIIVLRFAYLYWVKTIVMSTLFYNKT